MRNDADRLRDILDAITAIESRTSDGRNTFDTDPLIRVWVIHHLLIIGEAASRLTKSLTDASTSIPWPQIVGLRNILVHQYFGVDHNLVWGIVERDLLPLEQSITQLLASLNP